MSSGRRSAYDERGVALGERPFYRTLIATADKRFDAHLKRLEKEN